jgi:hypothetical protein
MEGAIQPKGVEMQISESVRQRISEHSKRDVSRLLSILQKWLAKGATWENAIIIGLLIPVSFLAFYNLDINPRPWHDEGSAMSVSKTLAEDDVYAVRSSDGYQTFGGVQSVGPTVLLPIALSFNIFGVGLVQARVVVAISLLLTLVLFYRAGLELFGRATALLTVLLLLGSPGVEFLLHGRQVLGEVPALGFFLGGWLVWAHSIRTGRRWLILVSGLLFGAAMVTKSQYTLIGLSTIISLAILDWLFFRQGNIKQVLTLGLIAIACVAAWWAWQWLYFGAATFQENAIKMRQLAATTSGLDLHAVVRGVTFLVGTASGHFYYFWGFPALTYMIAISLRRDLRGYLLAFLIVFTLLWLGYWLFWTLTWSRYAFPAIAISSLFVAKLWHDLAQGFIAGSKQLWSELQQGRPIKADLSQEAMMILGTSVALIVITLMAGYHLQRVVRDYVLDREGQQGAYIITAPQLESPRQVADYLNATVDKNAVVETWERELDILTDHRYHFPDQAFLAQTDAAVYRDGPRNYALGAEYFQKYQPDYVVVGWYARYKGIYDAQFLTEQGDLLATIGDGVWRYDVYALHISLTKQ